MATCSACDEEISVARELPLARKVWELLHPLQVNADSVGAERHMSNSFQIGSPDTEPHDLFSYSTFTSGLGGNIPMTLDAELMPAQRMPPATGVAPSIMGLSSNNSLGPSYSVPKKENALLAHIRPWMTANPPAQRDISPELNPDSSYSQQGRDSVAEFPYFSIETASSGRPSMADQSSISSPAPPRPQTVADKARRSWKVPLPFQSTKRPLPTVSGETSSIASNHIDEYPIEEIPLGGLFGAGLKTSAKTKAVAGVHVALSQSSTYGLLWGQCMIHVWDLSTTPPSQVRTIPTESGCILAAVGRRYVAYVIGSRGQKLTVR